MATLQCVRPQTVSTIDILEETANGGNVPCSRRALSPKRRRRRFTKFEVSLVVVSALLLVALIATALVLTLSKSRGESDDQGIRNPSKAILSLAQILSNMDNTVDPCEDFYQYACGGWLKKMYIDDADDDVFTFKQVQKENRRTLREILENEKFRSNYSRNPSILKVFDLYSSCMNTTAIENFGDSELKELYSELGVFNITKDPGNGRGYRWDDLVVKVKRRLGLDVFFNLEIRDDLRNSSIQRITMRAVQLGLNQKTYTARNSSKKMKLRQYYLEYMVDLMELATGKNRSTVRKEMDLVLDLEWKIAKTQLTPDQQQNISLIYNLVSIQTLTNKTSAEVDWLIFFRNLTSGAGYVLKEDEELLITSPEMIKEIVILLNKTDSRVISNYIAWTVVRNLIDALPKRYGSAYTKFLSDVFKTDLQGKPKWIKCIEVTTDVFPLPTASLFAAHALPKDRVNESTKLLNYVKEAFLKVIPRQLWLDKRSQSGALEKARAMIFDVAYPDHMSSASSLAQTYLNLTVSTKSYFATNVNIKSSLFMKSFKSLKTTVDRRKFENFDPLTPTASNYFTRNKVALSVGLLRNPFYHGDSYKFLNFGALGMVIGHEITHGFDQRGHRFNKNGHEQKWMSNESMKNLSEKTLCFSKQYSQFKYNGQNTNGNTSLRESFSDSGGLKLAFDAYKLWERHNSEEPIVAGLQLTNHQLFYLSYAQMWCAKYRESRALEMLKSGRYLPSELRVRGSVMNSRNFADTYSCPVGSAMNPKKKCDVW